jgi:hypothetical protein
MSAITYAPDLVEEAVLLAERTLPASEVRTFRRERDRLYDLPDADRREGDFRALHLKWFAHLRLHQVIEQTMASRAALLDRVSGCRVSRALTQRDEGADLVDPSPATARAGEVKPALAIRLRPAALLAREALRSLLVHELTHIADMLDPTFKYARALPPSDDGPSADNILRDRYRVLWDVTIDGRLSRAGLVDQRARDVRRQEFTATFAMLGDEGQRVFDDWFDRIQPTHPALVAFVQEPNGHASTNPADSGRCPLCHFPVAALDAHAERLPAAALAILRVDFPEWRPEQGLCAQCLDLYEARYEETTDFRRH